MVTGTLPVMEDSFEMTDMIAVDSFVRGGNAADGSGPIPELPSPDTRRWVVRRKAVVVQAVRNGTITLQEACRRYSLSVEEFLGWQHAFDSHGLRGLSVKRLQGNRRNTKPRT